MELVQVHVVGPEPAQAVLQGLFHVRRRRPFSVVVQGAAELGADDHLWAAFADRPAEVLLAAGASVDIGGVEEVDAGIERRRNYLRARRLVQSAPEVVAAEADQRDVERPDLAYWHDGTHSRKLPAGQRGRVVAAFGTGRRAVGGTAPMARERAAVFGRPSGGGRAADGSGRVAAGGRRRPRLGAGGGLSQGVLGAVSASGRDFLHFLPYTATNLPFRTQKQALVAAAWAEGGSGRPLISEPFGCGECFWS